MANTVKGPYSPTTWTNGSTPLNQTNLGNLETQASVALNGFNGDLLSAFVLSGITCTKDGTNANQLDIASGRAYLTLSDGTRGLIVVANDNTHTTATPSTTYHLYLQPDGTWYWSTSNSPAANSLAICTVTTDGSSNILAVTDARPLSPTLLGGAAGSLAVPNNFTAGGELLFGGASGVMQSWGSPLAVYTTPQSGAANSHLWQTWDGGATRNAFAVGDSNTGGPFTRVGAQGEFSVVGLQASVGALGVPVIVAQTIRQHVTTVGSNVTILSYTPGVTGLYRVNGYVLMQDAAARALGFFVTWTDPDLGSGLSEWLTAPGGVSGTTIQAFNNSNTWNNGVAFGAYSTPFMAKASTGIIISYQHDTGAANDYVTAIIERLA